MNDEGSPFPRERRNLLLDAYPTLARELPFLPLVHAPTPIEPCDTLSAYLGRGGVFIKRDDLVNPLYGGNKVRRFEFLFADAKERGKEELVTVGGLASTQVMATAILGRAVDFPVSAVLFDQPLTDFARQAMLTSHAAGARLIYGGSYLRTGIATLLAYARGRRASLILPGASSPLANLGYVEAMLELAEQVQRGEMPRPEIIVLPTGSGGTLAGLTVGARLLGWSTLIVGVRITELIACNRLTIRMLLEATRTFLQKRAPAAKFRGEARALLHHGAIGSGYGHSTPEALVAMPHIESLIGVPGEITYSAKALVGLREIAQKFPDKTILLWQTLSSRSPEVPSEPPADFPRALTKFFCEGDRE